MQGIIPPINTKGKFTFKEPYNTKIFENHEYQVESIRSLVELYNSDEKPFDTIYKAVGLNEDDFKSDIDDQVSIVVFKTGGGEYFYVPANRILSMPQVHGAKYQEITIAIPLGLIPLDYDLTLLKDSLAETVNNTIGVETQAGTVLTSAVTLLDKTQDATYRQLLANRRTVFKSYRTRYEELLEQYDKKTHLLDQLQICFKEKGVGETTE